MVSKAYNDAFKNDKKFLSLCNETERLQRKKYKVDNIISISTCIFPSSVILFVLAFIYGFISPEDVMNKTFREFCGIAAVILGVVAFVSLSVLIFNKMKSSLLWTEDIMPLHDQMYEMFVEKMQRDLKEQYNAVFFNSEVHPSYSKYEIQFDNGKNYMARVFYNDGKMIVEILHEKNYLKPTGVPESDNNKKSFDVIEGLKNI